jgi:RNA polymerase sigma factor (sigma-70 family)
MKDNIEYILWQQIRQGDNNAFSVLMSQYFRLLYQYGCKFSKDETFVKDCIQDLFLNLWERRERLSPQVSIKPYLMASLRRLIHRHHLKDKGLFDNLFETESSLFEIEFSVEAQYIEDETYHIYTKHLQKLLDKLPKRQQEVVYLRFFQNLDREQIAQVMNIAPQTVSNLLQMALKQMRSSWNLDISMLLLLLIIAQ